MADESIQSLKNIFPMVDEDILKKVLDASPQQDLAYIADVLESAAERGKVPNEDYMAIAAEELVNTDEMPQYASKEAILRGMRARQDAEGTSWERNAVQVASQGSFADLIEFHNRLNTLANDSLRDPGTQKIAGDVGDAMVVSAQEIAARIDEMADAGDHAALQDAAREAGKLKGGEQHDMGGEAFRERILNKISNVRQLLENEGSEYELARENLLDEENTPQDVEREIDRIKSAEYDVTWEQALDLLEEAREWLNDYREFQQQSQQPETEGQT